MPRGSLNSVLHFLRQLCDEDSDDCELLRRFAKERDGEAFAGLVRRHGPLVLGVCRRMLQREEDAEDVFQATFLVLARQASSIQKRKAIGSWLYGVARRLSLQAQADAARRESRERQVAKVPWKESLPEIVWRDLRPVVDEEVAALPQAYRDAFILCHLQGLTNEEASRELACPLGTVLSRLSRARQILRDRLTQRGITLSTAVLSAALSENAVTAAVPAAYLDQTMKAAVVFAAHNVATAGSVSAYAATLAEGVLRSMYFSTLRCVAGIVLAVGIVSTAVYSQQGSGKDLPEVSTRKAPETDKPTTSAPPDLAGKTAPTPRLDKTDDAAISSSVPPITRAQAAAEPLLTGVSPTFEKPFSDPTKEQLRLANKVLQEEIEDEKDRLEALQKKLQRLRKSGLSVPEGDPELTKLRQQSRLLQQQLKNLQSEVRVVEEEVEPFKRALLKGAGQESPRSDAPMDSIKNNLPVDQPGTTQKKF
jgi:RNA polymerase sigma factor (sigma-70 family)